MAAENPCLPYGGHEWSPTIHWGPYKATNTCIYCKVRRTQYSYSPVSIGPIYDWPDRSTSSREEHPNGWHPDRCPFTNETGAQCVKPWGHIPRLFSSAYCMFPTEEADEFVASAAQPVEPMNSAGRFKPAFSRLRRG